MYNVSSNSSSSFLKTINLTVLKNNNSRVSLLQNQITSMNFDGDIPRNLQYIAASSVKNGNYFISSASTQPDQSLPLNPKLIYSINKTVASLDPLSYNLFFYQMLDSGEILQINQSAISQDSYIWVYKDDWTSITPGSNGWALTTDGNAIFSNVFVRGNINADTGTIGGNSPWYIAEGSLTSGAGTNAVGLTTSTYSFYAGNETASLAPFYVTNTGDLYAQSASISGSINAAYGNIAGWAIQSNQLNSTSGTGKNLFSPYDPSFESSGIISGLNYWTAKAALNTTTSKSTTSIQDGTYSLKVTTRNPAPDVPDSVIISNLIPTLGLLSSGSTYTFSGYVRANVSNGNPTARVYVSQYDSSQSYISTSSGAYTSMSGWTRSSASFTTASNAAYVSFLVEYSTDGTYTVGSTFTSAYYDAMQLESGSVATTYEFSGFTGLYGTTSSASQYKIKFGLSETSNPIFSVDIFGNTQAKSFFVGDSLLNQSLYIDTQSIQSQYNSSSSKFYINKTYGGDVYLGNSISSNITSYSVTANTVTVTIADTSKLRINDSIVISGTTPTSGTSVNGTYTILTIPTKTTFTYLHPFVTTGAGTGGTYTTYYASNLTVYGNITANNGYITINGTQVNLGGTITVSSSPSSSVTITDDNTNNTRYITFVSASGTTALLADTTTGPLIYNPSTNAITATSFIGTSSSSNYSFNSASLGGQSSAYYAPISSPTFTGTVNLGTNIATGSVSFSNNSASLGAAAASLYSQTTAIKGLYNAGTLVAEATGGLELTLHRVNSASEGGQLTFNKALDDTFGWYIDLYGSTASPVMRWVDGTSTVKMTLDPSTGLNVTSNVVYNQSTNSQSGSAYTLAISDSGKFVEMTSSAANTITVPSSATVGWAIGSRIDIVQYGTGQTTISPASGVTINFYSPTSAATRTIKARYGAATLAYRAANEWLLIGNLT